MNHTLQKIFLSMALLASSMQAFAEADKQRIESVLEILRQSVNTHDYSMLEPQLDEDFTYQGQDGYMSTMIMKQVVADYPREITDITILGISQIADGWKVEVRLEIPSRPDDRQVTISSDYRIRQADIADIRIGGHG